MNGRYDRRGVSADKEEVHHAVKELDKGLYPNAFCKILPDIAGRNTDYCNIMHSDTAGSKTSLAYIYWKETGDDEVWKGIAQDALIMNVDDLICVGATGNIVVSSTIGRNRHVINGEILASLIRGTAENIEELNRLGIGVTLAGGETADVGDIVRTIDVGFSAFTRMKKQDVLEVAIQAGDVIVGLASYGQARYESGYNSGIGCNGLTSARHDVLAKYLFARYPESYDPAIPQELVYSGSLRLTDIEQSTGIQVGKLLLSPTRTYAPVVKQIFETVGVQNLHGLIHCSGGGQTKVMHFAGKDITIIKDNLHPLPPVFQMIQKESGTEWKEMYQVFNMGHRMECYLPAEYASKVLEISSRFGIEARIIGRCEASEQRALIIKSPYGEFIF